MTACQRNQAVSSTLVSSLATMLSSSIVARGMAAKVSISSLSFTKTVLAICALRLVEEGRLDLDASRRGKPYTLRHLLQHRAGLPDYGLLKAYRDAVARNDVPWSRQHLFEAVGVDRLDFPPGTGWTYSNIGYMFIRDAIEEATGLSLAAALRELVLEPSQASSARLATKPSDFGDMFWPAVRTYDPRWVYHGCLIGTPIRRPRCCMPSSVTRSCGPTHCAL
jgi:D-alanyl-D-alanine carboxypeptidase